MPAARTKPLSLRAMLLGIFLGTLLFSLLLFASFAVYLIFSRITTSEMNLLDRSITIHWQEYQRFFSEEEAVLRVIAGEPGTLLSLKGAASGQRPVFPSLGGNRFRVLIDRKVDRMFRGFLPLVASGSDILWICGHLPAGTAVRRQDDERGIHLTLGGKWPWDPVAGIGKEV